MPQRTANSDVIKDIVTAAALQNEVAVSVLRTVFTLALLLRFLVLDLYATDKYVIHRNLIVVSVAVIAIVFSQYFLYRKRKNSVPDHWLTYSVLVDALTWFFAFLADVIFPYENYGGLFSGADILPVIIIVIAAGLRLSMKLALFGGLLNIIAVFTLVLLDFTLGNVSSKYSWSDMLTWLIVLTTCTGMATAFAWRTGDLAIQGGIAALEAEQARGYLKSLLYNHHDANNILSALRLSLDQLFKNLSENTIIDRLKKNINDRYAAMRYCVQQIMHTADGDVIATTELMPVDINKETKNIVTNLQGLIQEIKIEFKGVKDPKIVNIAGGSHGYYRVVINLVKNAAQGRDDCHAKTLAITIISSENEVAAIFEDDGPGFGENDCDQDVEQNNNVNLDGFGVGLRSVRHIVEASNGRLETGRSTNYGGALIKLVFPRKDSF